VNYRHQFHAGNFADVAKHVVLGCLFEGMQRKEKGFLYLDTHAGRGRYDLVSAEKGETLPRRPEWPEGFGRILSAGSFPLPVEKYLSAVKAFDRKAGNLETHIRFYPGSPWLARTWMRPQDRLALCELQPDEVAFLAGDFSGERSVRVHSMDGYAAMRAMLPSAEKRALVLIDPPFESAVEWTEIVAAVGEGLRRLPGGTFAVWYPLTERARVARFASELERLNPPATWAAEVTVAGEAAGLKMRGCGLVVVNPPWQLDREVEPVLQWLAQTLRQAPGGAGTLRWMVSER